MLQCAGMRDDHDSLASCSLVHEPQLSKVGLGTVQMHNMTGIEAPI